MAGHRQSPRLQGYDYSLGGCYFVTICTRDRLCLFGTVVGGAMRLNGCGQVAHDGWCRSADLRAELDLDAFVVMPNHIHGIVVIHPAGDAPPDMGRGDRPVALRRPM